MQLSKCMVFLSKLAWHSLPHKALAPISLPDFYLVPLFLLAHYILTELVSSLFFQHAGLATFLGLLHLCPLCLEHAVHGCP